MVPRDFHSASGRLRRLNTLSFGQHSRRVHDLVRRIVIFLDEARQSRPLAAAYERRGLNTVFANHTRCKLLSKFCIWGCTADSPDAFDTF